MMRLIAAFACFALLPAPAWAEPGGAAEVYGPGVSQGESELELRSGMFDGGPQDGEWQVKAEFSHGVTDWWRPGLVAKWESASDDFTAFAIENVFDFTVTREWPVHVGAYFEYQFAEAGADEIELKLLLERERGPVDLRLNLIAERQVGAGASDAWEYGYAAQAGYALNDDFVLGVQGFGDAGAGALDDHAHYWGPFGQFELAHVGSGEVELQLGYLFGSGEAIADGQLRFKLEYEFGDAH
jgi:hypothetical protein